MPTYSTNFALDETPVSERNIWFHNGTLWTKVITAAGIAQGTQGTLGGFDDSNAYLSGYLPDHSASAVIAKTVNAAGGQEVELLLRWNDTPSLATGYECNLHRNGDYAEVVRWNGGLGSFDIIGTVLTIAPPVDGDVFSADIVGNNVTLKINGGVILTTDITSIGGVVYTSGNPGMGFFRADDGAASKEFGFRSYSATDGRLGPPSGRRSPAPGMIGR